MAPPDFQSSEPARDEESARSGATGEAAAAGGADEQNGGKGSKRRRRWPWVVLALIAIVMVAAVAVVAVALSDFAFRRWWVPLGLSMATETVGGEITVGDVTFELPGRLTLREVEYADVMGGVSGSADLIYVQIDLRSLTGGAAMPLIEEIRLTSADAVVDLRTLELPEEEPYDPEAPLLPVAIRKARMADASVTLIDATDRRTELRDGDLLLADFIPGTTSTLTLNGAYEVPTGDSGRTASGGFRLRSEMVRDEEPGTLSVSLYTLLDYAGALPVGEATTETLNLEAVLTLGGFFATGGTFAGIGTLETIRDGAPGGSIDLQFQYLTGDAPRFIRSSAFDPDSELRLQVKLNEITPAIVNPLLAATSAEQLTTGTLNGTLLAYEAEGVYRTGVDFRARALQLAGNELHGATPAVDVAFSQSGSWNAEEGRLTLAGMNGEVVEGDRRLLDLHLNQPLTIEVDPEQAPYVKSIRLLAEAGAASADVPTTAPLARTTDTLTSPGGVSLAALRDEDPVAAGEPALLTGDDEATTEPATGPPLTLRIYEVTAGELAPWLLAFQAEDAFPFEAGTLAAELELAPVAGAAREYRLEGNVSLTEAAYQLAEVGPPLSPLGFRAELAAHTDDFTTFTLESMNGSARHEDNLLVEWSAEGLLRDPNDAFALAVELSVPDLPYTGYLLDVLDPTAELLLDSGSLAGAVRLAKSSADQPIAVTGDIELDEIELFSYRGEPLKRNGTIEWRGAYNSVAERLDIEALTLVLTTLGGEAAGQMVAEGFWPTTTPPAGAPPPPNATGGRIEAEVTELDLAPWLDLFGLRMRDQDVRSIPATADLLLTVDPAGEVYTLEGEERIGPVELDGVEGP